MASIVFACERLSSLLSSVTLPASRWVGRQVRGRSAAAWSGAWPLRQLILHGGPVRLRPVRKAAYYVL